MLADWLSDDGRRAIEKMGWPEWTSPDLVGRVRLGICPLRVYAGGGAFANGNCWGAGRVDEEGNWKAEMTPVPAIALALLRDRARVWLAERETWIEPSIPGPGWQVKIVATFGSMPLAWKRDYDAALVAAVLATEKGKT